ncbi:MAG: hypothetical protein MUP98_01535 [Candidatus Aminicenantes bacterium]|nr:hypothetical protein [Candidatus Aminicenantes bacterium]
MDLKFKKRQKKSVLILGLIMLLVLGYTSILSGDVLTFIEAIQENDQWCWAGVSRTILYYYGMNVAQCTIADYTRTQANWHNFGSVNCCTDPTQGCNYWNYMWGSPGGLREILAHWGVSTGASTRQLYKSEVEAIINDNRPFIIRWGWTSGGGHFLAGQGIEGNNVYYMDPWFGEGFHVASYDWVVSGGGHDWTDSLSVTEPYTVTQYSLAINATSGGTTNPIPGTYQYSKNTQVSVRAIPDNYHVFSHWSGNASGSNNPVIISMTANKSITANFRIVYAPLNFSGSQAINRNLYQIEYYNTLSWSPNPNNQGINIVKYRIYLINDTTTVVGEVNADSYQYIHRRAGSGAQEYAIVGVLDDDRIGYASFIIVQ